VRSGTWRSSLRHAGCGDRDVQAAGSADGGVDGAWVADTCAPGDVVLPKDSYKTIVKFVAGKDATGTVWVDDVMFYGRAGQWAGQDWGTNLEYPTGWYYWLPADRRERWRAGERVREHGGDDGGCAQRAPLVEI